VGDRLDRSGDLLERDRRLGLRARGRRGRLRVSAATFVNVVWRANSTVSEPVWPVVIRSRIVRRRRGCGTYCFSSLTMNAPPEVSDVPVRRVAIVSGSVALRQRDAAELARSLSRTPESFSCLYSSDSLARSPRLFVSVVLGVGSTEGCPGSVGCSPAIMRKIPSRTASSSLTSPAISA
jgi:hypothetical protein